MRLTDKTIPQVKRYQCDKCKKICCHKEMFDSYLCYECYDIEFERKKDV